MSIKSNAFGGVILSGADAKKFKNQVLYGKPKKAAVEAIKRGVELSRAFEKHGKISFALKRSKVRIAT